MMDEATFDRKWKAAAPFARAILSRLPNREDREDALAHCHLKAWKSRGTSHLVGFARMVRAFAQWAVSDFVRNASAGWRRVNRVRFIGISEDHPDGGASPLDLVLAQESLSIARGLLQTLPPGERAALNLHAKGLSQNEIASRLNITRTAVNARLYRARQTLAASL